MKRHLLVLRRPEQLQRLQVGDAAADGGRRVGDQRVVLQHGGLGEPAARSNELPLAQRDLATPFSGLSVAVYARDLDGLLQRERRDFLLIAGLVGAGLVFSLVAAFATVRAIADEVIVMLQGKIVEKGPKDDMFTPPHHEYTDLLLSSVPEMDPNWLDELMERRAKEGVMQSTSIS